MPKVYFIQEQRLLRPVIKSNKKLEVLNDKNIELFTLQPYEQGSFSNTIEIYAIELSQIFKEKLAESSKINQELDSSFPRRLFDQKDGISEKEFKQRFDQVKKIQKALSEFGLLDIEEDSHPTYKSENANALSVYINDIERKMAVYTEILDKLKVFTNILNERRFTFKRIHISAKDGFKFATDKGQFLELADLSSGEQQEVVMLYELLFKVQPGTLVLVDEPELSLHVVWQKEFLDDLFQILKLQDITIIIATHSPQIINNHWNLTVDLEDLNCASTYH